MKQARLETIVGFIVLIIAFGFFAFAYNMSNASKGSSGYTLIANFQNVDGISAGSDIKPGQLHEIYNHQITLS